MNYLDRKNHKEETYGSGDEQCFVKQCGSLRQAFVYEDIKDNESIELMHCYIPMGLDRQHETQSSILCRFSDLELAACYLSAASRELNMGYTAEACNNAVPEDAKKMAHQMKS